jgi:hypothetical protein
VGIDRMGAALGESGSGVNFVAVGIHGLLWFGRAGCCGPCFVDLYLVY